MKTKRFLCILLSTLILISTFAIPVMAEGNIKVALNGTELSFDVPPQLINDRTMVPMRKIFEALGATVEWYEEAQVAVATKGDMVVQLKIDSTFAIKNGQMLTLDVPPQVIDDRTLVPVRAVAECFEAEVVWDEVNQTVIITKEEQPITTPSPSETTEKLTYKNDKYGYSFEYMSKWGLMAESKDEAVIFVKDDPNEKVASTLTISIGSPSVNLATITNDYMERVFAPNYKSFKITESEVVTIDGVETKRFTANASIEDISLNMLFYIFNIKDNVCTFASISSKENADKDISELDLMFKSIKFESKELVNTKRVGEENYGYLTLPSNWANFMDSTVVQTGRKSVGFMSFDGLIINLDYYGSTTVAPKQLATNAADRQKNNGAKSVEVKEIKINDNIVTQRVECYYSTDNSKLFLWFFHDKNNEMHFVSAEGPVENVTEAVEIVEKTFSFTK